MRVRLSNPWEGHKTGDVVDLDEGIVRQLDNAGYLNRDKDGKPLVVAERAKKAAKTAAKKTEPSE